MTNPSKRVIKAADDLSPLSVEDALNNFVPLKGRVYSCLEASKLERMTYEEVVQYLMHLAAERDLVRSSTVEN